MVDSAIQLSYSWPLYCDCKMLYFDVGSRDVMYFTIPFYIVCIVTWLIFN